MSVTTNQKTLRVLVVDDNQDHANSLSMLLKAAGHDSHVCVDAQDCMASVDRLRPDVVLLDLGMPGVSGYEVAEVIKSEADLRHIRLIAITGHGMPLDRLQTKKPVIQNVPLLHLRRESSNPLGSVAFGVELPT